MKGPKGYLITLLNTMSRENGHSLDGKLNKRLARIINRPVTRGQVWPLLLEEYAKRKGLPTPKIETGAPHKSGPKKKPRNKSRAFYTSKEWQSIRFDALKMSDGAIHFGHGSIIVDGNKIITILAKGQRPAQSGKAARRRKREAVA